MNLVPHSVYTFASNKKQNSILQSPVQMQRTCLPRYARLAWRLGRNTYSLVIRILEASAVSAIFLLTCFLSSKSQLYKHIECSRAGCPLSNGAGCDFEPSVEFKSVRCRQSSSIQAPGSEAGHKVWPAMACLVALNENGVVTGLWAM